MKTKKPKQERLIIPSKFFVLGKAYDIKLLDKVIDSKNRECWGRQILEDYQIELTKNNKNIMRTLTHELAHCFLFQTCMAEDNEQNASILGGFLWEMISQLQLK